MGSTRGVGVETMDARLEWPWLPPWRVRRGVARHGEVELEEGRGTKAYSAKCLEVWAEVGKAHWGWRWRPGGVLKEQGRSGRWV